MTEIILQELIEKKIYFIRVQKVMLNKDLAELYGVETRILNQAVRRNIKRFPVDFMCKGTAAVPLHVSIYYCNVSGTSSESMIRSYCLFSDNSHIPVLNVLEIIIIQFKFFLATSNNCVIIPPSPTL